MVRPPLAGYARARLAQLRRRQGRYDEARALLTEAGTHVLVPLVEAELRLDAARRAHGRLAAIADDVGSAALRAAERLAAGRVSLAERDAEDARAALEDAADGYERCVMPFEAEQARADLARATEPGLRQGDLTRREAEVLALIAQGLSNRKIAERLIVSEHTVHRHVANIFVRLGVSSRAAAVAVASASGHFDEDGPVGR